MKLARVGGCWLWVVVVGLVVCGWASPAWAALLAYEGFDYPAGPIGGQSGGVGWPAAWTNGGGTGDIVEGGLTYTDSMGNELVVSGNHLFTSGQSASAQIRRDIAMQGADGTTTWWSFIGQRLSPHPTEDENLIRAASLQIHLTGSSPVERLAVGKGTTAAPSQTDWSMLHSGNVANAVYSTSPMLEQAFLVVRIDHFGDSATVDNAYLWVNPRLDIEPDINAADAQYLGALDFSFNHIRTFAGNSNDTGPYADFDVDEIRFGTTFADVAPIVGETVPLLGDYDNSGRVDAGDYVLWRNGGPLANEGDNPGTVEPGDYVFWRDRYGATSAVVAVAVPEPAAPMLVGLALVVGVVGSRRRAVGGRA